MAAQQQRDDDAQVARVSAFVRPLRTKQYTDPRGRSHDRFDVILTAGAASASKTPFFYIERSPRDFAQLQRELELELELELALNANSGVQEDTSSSYSSHVLTTPLVITPAIDVYLATQGDDESTEAAAVSLQLDQNATVEFENRFAWQLEHFLTALANHADARVCNSLALKKFIRGGSERLSIEDREAMETWFLESSAATVHDRIASGCSVKDITRVHVGDDDTKNDGEGSPEQQYGQALVLWRFASQGKNILFSARFLERDHLAEEVDDGSNGGYDPYAATDPYSASTEDEADDANGDEKDDDNMIMAQYNTYYSFPEVADGDNSSSLQYEYGYFLVTMSGDLVLEWENVDDTTILSKPLAFQVRVLTLPEAVGASEEIKKLVRKVSGTQQSHSAAGDLEGEEDASWLQKLIKASKITSLNEFLRRSEDYIDDAIFTSLNLDTPHDRSPCGNGDERGCETEMLKRVQEEKAFHEQRARYVEERATQLEDELRATKNDLKKAQESITISEEIYKASLETITQLEVAASASQQKSSTSQIGPSSLKIPSLLSLPASAPPCGTEEAAKPKDGAVVSAKEHQRVVNLCTTFQEQCLWRSIELGESEKRNLVLEAKLQDSEQEKVELQAQTTLLEEMVAALQAEVKKLKTHKSILVQEVKKLQPYSQVNITALVQEAQEARMMQRSLQAQLDSRDIVESTSSAPAATAVAITAEEDGAGGGFVVVESDEHSSFFHGTSSRQ